ncbi:MAG: hypothetical protein ABII00_00315 [Elusimicrobiota bacterium]
MIKLRLMCRYCRKSLMDRENRIDSKPSIRFAIKYGKKKGDMFVSGLYGSYTIRIPFAIPKGKILSFFCPHCSKEMSGTRVCEACRAPMIPIALQEGGMVQVCARMGCKKHIVEFEDPEAEIRAFYAKYSTFFK